MKNKLIIVIAIVVTILIIVSGLLIWYKVSLKPVKSKNNGQEIVVEIDKGNGISSIAEILKNNKVIRNKLAFKIFIKLNGKNNLQAGKYKFNNGEENVEQIVQKMANGEIFKDEVTITFIEGKNMRSIAKVIAENTNNTEEDVFNLLNDKNYINSLLEKYWFLTDEITDEQIYYPLEGYLLPDTYTFENKEVSVETIFNVILNFTEKYLNENKEKIEGTGLSVHQLLTMASITELEGNSTEDRKQIIGVFYNRIIKKMNLGSDVTTYYAVKIDMGERNLTKEEINIESPYNTRFPKMAGKIPIGPICNPSKDAIEATINYTKTDALYFVADKNGKIYFTKTNDEHNAKIRQLKKEGLWFSYEEDD